MLHQIPELSIPGDPGTIAGIEGTITDQQIR